MASITFIEVPVLMRKLVRAHDRSVLLNCEPPTKMSNALRSSFLLAFETKWNWICEMAKTPATKKKQATQDFKWQGFVNIQLTASQRENWKLWSDEYDNLWELLTVAVAEGFKISVTYNPKNENYVATLVCQDMGRPEGGYCLSAFAPDIETSVSVLMFKHYIICPNGWPIDSDGSQKNEDFG